MKEILKWFLSMMVVVIMIGTASALPEIMDGFNMKYVTFGTGLDNCDTCHISNKPQKEGYTLNSYGIDLIPNKLNKPQEEGYTLNSYGIDLKNNLNIGINEALSKIEILDSDKDKYSNIDEINNLTFPGDKKDFPPGKRKDKRRFQISPIDIIDYSKISNYQPP